MCLRQAGTRNRKTTRPMKNFANLRSGALMATARTPSSKHRSHEKPMRMAMAWMMTRIALAPSSAEPLPLVWSSTKSNAKTARPQRMDRTSARVTWPIMVSTSRCMNSILRTTHLAPKRIIHAKHMARLFAITWPTRVTSVSSASSSPSLPPARFRDNAIAAKHMAVAMASKMMISFQLWTTGGSSRPSAFGMMPPTANRMA
mmetsp:Transcript_34652/g.79821  ORF Transcript_34652/g.79821 Transcript_34652/m.79821 type:complete len:202 (+) Transcript_34652:443-1048(+)